jgi:hypothetical protein
MAWWRRGEGQTRDFGLCCEERIGKGRQRSLWTSREAEMRTRNQVSRSGGGRSQATWVRRRWDRGSRSADWRLWSRSWNSLARPGNEKLLICWPRLACYYSGSFVLAEERLGVSWVEGQLFGENNRGAMGGLWEGKEASAGRGNPQLRSDVRLDGALTVVDDSKALSQRMLPLPQDFSSRKTWPRGCA